jgi:hypothetical protein
VRTELSSSRCKSKLKILEIRRKKQMFAHDEKMLEVQESIKSRLEELIKAVETTPDAQTLLFQTLQ